MYDRPAVDLHHLVQWRRFQGDQGGHDLREAGGRKAARRILLQKHAPGPELDQVQGGGPDDRPFGGRLGESGARQDGDCHGADGRKEPSAPQAIGHVAGLSPEYALQ